MALAIEYMIRARVLVLKVYGQIAVSELREVPEKIGVHGCYFSGVPLLIELAGLPSPRLTADLQKLRISLRDNFPQSRIALAWDATASKPPDQFGDVDLDTFRSRAEALAWLLADEGR
jgi:hypothetical protein